VAQHIQTALHAVHGPRLRSGGLLVLAGGLLWQPMLAWEDLRYLQPRSASPDWYLDQAGFLLTMVLLLAGFATLDLAGFPGPARTGRLAIHGLVAAWALLVTAQIGALANSGTAADLLTGLGGLLTYPTTLIAGIVAVRGGMLTGWRRWALLGQALYQICVILLPILVWRSGPNWAAEAGWELGWVAVGVAAATQPTTRSSRTPSLHVG
jgi:hypothetical protein